MVRCSDASETSRHWFLLHSKLIELMIDNTVSSLVYPGKKLSKEPVALGIGICGKPWGSFLDPSTNSGMSHRIPHGWYTNGYSKWCMYTQTGYGIPNGVWQMVHKWYTNGVCADAYRLGLNENDASAQVWHDLRRGYRFLGRSHRLPVCTMSENQCPYSTYFLVLEFVRWLIFIYQ